MANQNKYVKELTLTRVFDAPRERVWDAWTDPKLLAQWWGPQGFTSPVCEVDARPGGALLIHMSGMGMLAPMTGIFKEVVKPERLVFTNNAFFEVAARQARDRRHHHGDVRGSWRQDESHGAQRRSCGRRPRRPRHWPAWNQAGPSRWTSWRNSCGNQKENSAWEKSN